MAKSSHVMPYGGRWAVKNIPGKGGRSSTSVYHTKQEAIDAGRSIARKRGVELIVHGNHGQIFRSPEPSGRFDEELVRAAVRTSSAPSGASKSAAKKSAAKKSAAKTSGAKKSGAKGSGSQKSGVKKSGSAGGRAKKSAAKKPSKK